MVFVQLGLAGPPLEISEISVPRLRVPQVSESQSGSAVLNMAPTPGDRGQDAFDEAGLELFRQLGIDSSSEPSEYDSVNVVFRSKNGGELLVGDHRFAK